MTTNEYEEKAATTANYKEKVIYPAVGLCGEAGEAADKVKKVIRDSNGKATEDDKKHIILELGDTMWYCAMLMRDLGMKFGDISRITKLINDAGTIAQYRYMKETDIVILMCAYASTAAQNAVIIPNKTNVVFAVANVVALIDVLANKYGYNLAQVGEMNIEKLASRKKRDKINGSGDDR